MLLAYEDIRHVHLEPSSLCNARCPLCPRNLYGVNRDDIGYQEHAMTLEEFKQIFTVEFLQQLEQLLCNGNFGDAIMNRDLIDMFVYAKSINPGINIKLTTNGGARDRTFWQVLADMDVYVIFSIDGLEDTNHLYRQDVNWNVLISNVQSFIGRGGSAEWKMVKFDHNQHQISAMRNLAKQLGFAEFSVTDHGRNHGPAFDRHGNYSHSIGDYQNTKQYSVIEENFLRKKTEPSKEANYQPLLATKIQCLTKQDRSIYINSVGEVYPCCFWGFATQTFGNFNDPQFSLIRSLMHNHNALEYGIRTAVEWFQGAEQHWFVKPCIGLCHEICGTTEKEPVVFYKNDERSHLCHG